MKRWAGTLALVAFVATTGVVALGAPAQAAVAPACRGSAVRVTLPILGTLEPFVAGQAAAPCVDDADGLLPPTTIGPVRASILTAATSDAGTADGSAANVRITVTGLPVITIGVAEATAAIECRSGTIALTGASHVVSLKIGATTINVPAGPLTVNAGPLAKLSLNEQTTAPGSLTQRAVHLSSALLSVDIVVGEAVVKGEGSCVPKPECSDGVDNADGEDTLADEDDPGCHTDGDPGNPGSYDPDDDDETDPRPECSDGVDNADGEDTLADEDDPGCHSDGDPGNPGSYDPDDDDETDPRPECSDGVDNDDGEDTLADEDDPGCHTDNDPGNPDSYDPNDDNETDSFPA